jgi:hypothetical protein
LTILAEGESDAMLLWQEVDNLIGVAALGSCTAVSAPGHCATGWAARGC